MAVRIKIGSTSAKRKVDQLTASSSSSSSSSAANASHGNLPAEMMGLSASAASSSSSSSGSGVTGQPSQSQSQSQGQVGGDGILTCRLFDLCDSSFISRNRKKRSRAPGNGTGAGASAGAVATSRGNGGAGANTGGGGVFVPSGAGGTGGGGTGDQHGGPQVEIIDGKIVIRESSLFVGPEVGGEQGPAGAGGPGGDGFAGGAMGPGGVGGVAGAGNGAGAGEYYEEIEENVNACATYASFSRRQSSASWGIEETRNFYRCLRQCGTEFSMMQTFFPKRTRKQLKLKFYREEKLYPDLVKCALSTDLPLDMDVFESQLSGGLNTAVVSVGDADAEEDAAADAVADGGEDVEEEDASASADPTAITIASEDCTPCAASAYGIDVRRYAADGDAVTV